MQRNNSLINHEFENNAGGNIICTRLTEDGSKCGKFPEEHIKKENYRFELYIYKPDIIYKKPLKPVRSITIECKSPSEAFDLAEEKTHRLFQHSMNIVKETKIFTSEGYYLGAYYLPSGHYLFEPN